MLLKRLFYFFDNQISKGTANIILMLTISLVVVVVLLGCSIYVAGFSDEKNVLNLILNYFYLVLSYTPPKETSLPVGIVSIILFIVGLFVSGALIGAITTGLHTKLADLQEGYGEIVEENHTIILGWSQHVTTIVEELILANESVGGTTIVILGRKTRNEMSSIINSKIKNFLGTKVIYRTGDRRSKNDLRQVSLDTSRNIIINQHSHVPSDIPKTLLAILNRKERRKKPFHITAVIENQDEIALARLIGKDELQLIESNDFLARLEAQTYRQLGLPYVYEDLLNFSGEEVYFINASTLEGLKYGDAIFRFNNSKLIGLCTNKNEILLNPHSDTLIQKDFQIIVIAEDDSTIKIEDQNVSEVKSELIQLNEGYEEKPEHYLVIGWNSNTESVIKNLTKFVPFYSSVTILTNPTEDDPDVSKLETKRSIQKQIVFKNIKSDHSSYQSLKSINFNDFDHVSIQGKGSLVDSERFDDADSLTIATLVYLREIRKNSDWKFPIVSELFDSSNYELIQKDVVDDFIISERIVSCVIAQIAENKMIINLYEELFKSSGSEIYLKPAGSYIKIGSKIDFFTVMESARQRNETAIGFRLNRYSQKSLFKFNGVDLNFGVCLNPMGNSEFEFEFEDKIVVLAES